MFVVLAWIYATDRNNKKKNHRKFTANNLNNCDFIYIGTESSPESNYVPGSFSAKGRAKLRPMNGPFTNFDTTWLQVDYVMYLFFSFPNA